MIGPVRLAGGVDAQLVRGGVPAIVPALVADVEPAHEAERAVESACDSDASSFATFTCGIYSLEELVAGVEDQKSPKKEKIYFLRRLPRDPLATDPALGPAESWGKRSYESPPDDPREGDDVFDVYSLSPMVGINGRPYREW